MKSMINVIMLLACYMLVSCATVERPDLPIKKTSQGTYAAKQKRFLGIPCGKPFYEKTPTKIDTTKDQIRKPAVWSIAVAFPLGLVAFACALFLHNPAITKKSAILAMICGVVVIGSAAWLLATTYLLLFIPFVIGIGVYGYLKMRGRGFRWHKDEEKQ